MYPIQYTIDTILYPKHVSFGGDIINSGTDFYTTCGDYLSNYLPYHLWFVKEMLFTPLPASHIYIVVSLVGIFSFAVIFWRTLYSLIQTTHLPPGYQCRQSRQSKLPQNNRVLRFYPFKWLIRSVIIISCSRQTHPVTQIPISITSTVKRMHRMHDLVSCSSGVLCQYNSIRASEFFTPFRRLLLSMTG